MILKDITLFVSGCHIVVFDEHVFLKGTIYAEKLILLKRIFEEASIGFFVCVKK